MVESGINYGESIMYGKLFIYCLVVALFTACGQGSDEMMESSMLTWESVQDSTARVHTVSGFSGPEAVRYDPGQDVYFVANFNGGGNTRDANGFISRVSPEGTVENLEFITGTDEYPLHAPRGMYITDDIIWAADADGVHGFNRMTGVQVDFVDFSEFEPGFLNDLVQGPDGHIYVTDTGTSRLFQINDGIVTVVHDSLPYSPNGITLDPESGRLILAPWGGVLDFSGWSTTDSTLDNFGSATSGGNFDGIEFYSGYLLAASQIDSSLHAIQDGMANVIIRMPGRPADIGLDTQRNQVAVPYVARNEVDIWQLPE